MWNDPRTKDRNLLIGRLVADGLKHKEIAERLGMEPGRVSSLMQEYRKRLFKARSEGRSLEDLSIDTGLDSGALNEFLEQEEQRRNDNVRRERDWRFKQDVMEEVFHDSIAHRHFDGFLDFVDTRSFAKSLGIDRTILDEWIKQEMNAYRRRYLHPADGY